ncbi:hypothetical protein [Amycolatopsis sp. DG1A-15b]|uniref:hypothetical protein n=1 Tax=Amycolatopsis sp. DG1A-15b TaxID=3052846 RepID=UPI00255B5ACD|nr:hypothetical protein [Amycolatopsis sp. DG1A-15b]WIX85784.1 hypothetical protein QRY02_31845 [Amycolatopsis sp. DG1A-15b]WIX89773.1 hypothetical protein QRY02_04800 [Amycolatopsis sp. DG1A-15b]
MDDTAADEPKVVARVNIPLVQESGKALLRLQDRTGLKKVDLVNRAIQVYDFLASQLTDDREVVLRGSDGQEVLVKIFL